MFLVRSFVAMLAIIVAVADSRLIVNETDPNVGQICSLLPPNKYILRPHTCTNWVKCPSGVDVNDYDEGTCVPGLYYNKDDGNCAYENTVQCPYTVVIKNRCADKTDGVFLIDPESENCAGYSYCKGGQEKKSTCPSNLVFDPRQSACVYASDYKCPTSDQKVAASPICRSIGEKQIFANEEDCTQYHECVDGALVTHECADEMAFHHTIGRCVPREGVVCHPTAKKPLPDSKVCGTDGNPRTGYIADSQSCSGYYVCAKQPDNKADRHPAYMQCGNGHFFDESKWSCRDRLSVRCSLDRCEGMDNKYVNIAGDCTAYARCSNGISVATGHCPTDYFFDERTQGCTPQNINYIACASTMENKSKP